MNTRKINGLLPKNMGLNPPYALLLVCPLNGYMLAFSVQCFIVSENILFHICWRIPRDYSNCHLGFPNRGYSNIEISMDRWNNTNETKHKKRYENRKSKEPEVRTCAQHESSPLTRDYGVGQRYRTDNFWQRSTHNNVF